MIIRVEKVISVNGQEVRKTAQADIPDDHPRMDDIASWLMNSLSRPKSEFRPIPHAKPREWWFRAHLNNTPCPRCGMFNTKEAAATYAGSYESLIHVREVLPEEEGA